MTKGSDREAGIPRCSADWITARRGLFKVFRDRIELGDWRLAFADVERAVLYRIPYLPFVKASVLALEVDNRTCSFGFNPWARPDEHFPIPVEEREGKTPYSTFGVGVRVLALAYLPYLVYLVWDAVA